MGESESAESQGELSQQEIIGVGSIIARARGHESVEAKAWGLPQRLRAGLAVYSRSLTPREGCSRINEIGDVE
jgi:hypothetical protein